MQVKVVSARDLPIMDRSSELTDAFVEVGWTYEVPVHTIFNAYYYSN